MIARAAAAAALLAGCAATAPDPCGDALTCVRLDVSGLLIDQIDQLQLDIVLGGRVHSTVTTGTRGQHISLPTSTSIKLSTMSLPTTVDVVAAGRRDGQVVGLASGAVTVLLNDHASLRLELSDLERCTEDRLVCGSSVGVFDHSDTIYRCIDGAPIFYARCFRSCSDFRAGDAVCSDFGCTQGGHYCGGDKVEGDPFTLYTCDGIDGVMPTRCPGECLALGGGNDHCI